MLFNNNFLIIVSILSLEYLVNILKVCYEESENRKFTQDNELLAFAIVSKYVVMPLLLNAYRDTTFSLFRDSLLFPINTHVPYSPIYSHK